MRVPVLESVVLESGIEVRFVFDHKVQTRVLLRYMNECVSRILAPLRVRMVRTANFRLTKVRTDIDYTLRLRFSGRTILDACV